ncbi:MAG: M48 family metalloprotease [Planctomycetota bacterium]
MPNLLLIAACLSLGLRDMVGMPAGYGALGPWGAAGMTLGAMFAPALWGRHRFRQMLMKGASTGRAQLIVAGERRLRSAQSAACVVFIGGVLIAGWLDSLRRVIGDPVLIDELVALVPLLCVRWWLHSAQHRSERLLHGAQILGKIDRGEPVYPLGRTSTFALGAARQELALAVLPVLALLGWGETVAWLIPRLAPDMPVGIAELLQLLGAVVLLAVSPPFLAWVLGTTRLAAGELRERLEGIAARARVGLRDIRVWRTRGLLSNAAMTGLLGPLRVVLITDGLLDRLTLPQLEAVMAHEVGHAKLAHLPWLAGSLVGPVLIVASAGSWMLAEMGSRSARWAEVSEAWGSGVIAAGGLLVGFFVFGVVSRAFEREADAFAAGSLSDQGLVSADASEALSSALLAVTAANRGDPSRFSFRHGTVTGRVASLRELVGARWRDSRARRAGKWARGCTALLVVLGIVGTIVVG